MLKYAFYPFIPQPRIPVSAQNGNNFNGLCLLVNGIMDHVGELPDNGSMNFLVTNSEDYLYSSARNYAEMENVLEIELLSLPAITVK